MPRDKRLYMTFPNTFPFHRKITRLSVEARWAFVEMNGYSRIRDIDGVIPAEDAIYEWGQPILDELAGSHPVRPLIYRDGDNYVIREYAEHQPTKADREKKSADGKKAARARWDAERMQDAFEPHRSRIQESRVQSPERQTYVTESLSSNTPPDAETDAVSRGVISGLGIAPDRLVTHIKSRCGVEVTATVAMKVALDILGRADSIRTTNQRYVLGSITRSPAETEKFIFENGLAA